MLFWCSTDLSPGIEKLFDAMNLCDSSKSFDHLHKSLQYQEHDPSI
jgi:hypothetical protein